MNPIDRMLIKHANEIEICVAPNPYYFRVHFGGIPSRETLAPLSQLIESGRFSWSYSTQLLLKEDLPVLDFLIEKTNLIPVVEAIAALRDTWAEMGYSVTVVWKDGSKDKIEAVLQ